MISPIGYYTRKQIDRRRDSANLLKIKSIISQAFLKNRVESGSEYGAVQAGDLFDE